jgi:hypothetical protein
METKIDVTIKAQDREEVGKAMAELYADVCKALETRVLVLPGMAPINPTLHGTYPRDDNEKEKI